MKHIKKDMKKVTMSREYINYTPKNKKEADLILAAIEVLAWSVNGGRSLLIINQV